MPTEMIYLNGEVIPMADAHIGVEDRGYQFADGVYEVVRFYNARPFTLDEHLDRLERSCAGILLDLPTSRPQLADDIRTFITRAGLRDGMVYLQVTRGVAPRNHIFPSPAPRPTVLFYVRPLPPIPAPEAVHGAKLVSVLDERWKRCWIKAIALLPNILAKNQAIAAGADEAALVDDGIVTEGSATNILIISRGQLITHPVGPKVLPGITRLVLAGLARQLDIPFIERPVSEAEAIAADQVLITSTTRELTWISHWNGKPIASGPGPITLKLHRAYQAKVAADTR